MRRSRSGRAARARAALGRSRESSLNLVPLVDTFVSIVFFALTTSTVGELAPVVPGVTLPKTSVGQTAFGQLTLGIGGTVTFVGTPIMRTADAAAAVSDDPQQPLLIPALYRRLRVAADSVRTARGLAKDAPLDVPLAIQGDRTMRYDLLSRFMQTARSAGFTRLSLQVEHESAEGAPETGVQGPTS